ncbi:MAG: U32 family peptidase [Bacteroidales bacterium]|nr:U32 family peptidase [Bacteroidales bacterium]
MTRHTAGKLEIMAPAGNFECLHAAIQGGADSVYFGVEKLNMRSHSANNFKMTDLPEIVRICSEFGVKTYLTLNIALFDSDLEDMKKTLEAAKAAGITAVIASDMAAIICARQLGIEVHISTQLSISNAEALRFYAQFADVIVLARELNLTQVKEIKAIIDRDQICGPSGRLVEIEMFAHGALCMAISGKCYLSLHEYGASANRGSCFQLCRRAYDVRDRETGMELTIDNKYIMSPKDLCTIEFMDKIIDAGVTVFKIEGRARSAEYVKRVASCYRRAADAVCDGTYTSELGTAMKEELMEVFNRGFWDGYYQGARLGEWCDVYGSTATRKKAYCGKVTNWFGKLGVAEILVESYSLKVGDKILIIGPTSGCVEYTVPEIRVDLKPVQEASKGTYCSIPIDWNKVVPGAREEELGLCGDGCSESACKAIEEGRLRRSDKVYIWPEV